MSESRKKKPRKTKRAEEPAPKSTRRRVRPSKIAHTSSTKVRTKKGRGAETETTKEDIHVFTTEPAYVRVNAGVTKNLGDYESLRIDVSISRPCYPEHIDQTFIELSDDVSDKLADELERYLN